MTESSILIHASSDLIYRLVADPIRMADHDNLRSRKGRNLGARLLECDPRFGGQLIAAEYEMQRVHTRPFRLHRNDSAVAQIDFIGGRGSSNTAGFRNCIGRCQTNLTIVGSDNNTRCPAVG